MISSKMAASRIQSPLTTPKHTPQRLHIFDSTEKECASSNISGISSKLKTFDTDQQCRKGREYNKASSLEKNGCEISSNFLIPCDISENQQVYDNGEISQDAHEYLATTYFSVDSPKSRYTELDSGQETSDNLQNSKHYGTPSSSQSRNYFNDTEWGENWGESTYPCVSSPKHQTDSYRQICADKFRTNTCSSYVDNANFHSSHINISPTNIEEKKQDAFYEPPTKDISSEVHSIHEKLLFAPFNANTVDDVGKKSCDIDDMIGKFGKLSFELDKWTATALGARSDDYETRFSACKKFRMMLSVGGEIPIQAVIDTGIVSSLVDCVDDSSSPELQFEAAWALTNIASGTSDQTQVVVNHGGIDVFLKLLLSNREDLREQGLWGLGNIAGDSSELRDDIISTHNSLSLIVNTINNSALIRSIKTGVWSLTNFCRGHPRPDGIPFLESGIVRVLVNIIKKMDTYSEIVSEACWALDGLAETAYVCSSLVQDYNVVPPIMKLLRHNRMKNAKVTRSALRVLGQIATGPSHETQSIIDNNGIPEIVQLLDSEKKLIRKDACWTLSNIAAGTIKQKQKLIQHNCFEKCFHTYCHDDELEIKKEAAWAICHGMSSECPDQVRSILAIPNSMHAVCEMLAIPDVQVLKVVVSAIEHALELDDDNFKRGNVLENQAKNDFIAAGGTSRLWQVLQANEDINLQCKINELIHKFELIHVMY